MKPPWEHRSGGKNRVANSGRVVHLVMFGPKNPLVEQDKRCKKRCLGKSRNIDGEGREEGQEEEGRKE